VNDERALALVGFMGCGKSTVGRLVARLANARYQDLDTMVEGRAGMSITALFEAWGEPAFRALEAELLPQALQPGMVASLGGGVPMDDRNWVLIRRLACTVWLDAPLHALLARTDRASRPLLNGRRDDELQTLYDTRVCRYEQADHRLDATRAPDELAREVLQLWRA
jgi:shikimate kinase